MNEKKTKKRKRDYFNVQTVQAIINQIKDIDEDTIEQSIPLVAKQCLYGSFLVMRDIILKASSHRIRSEGARYFISLLKDEKFLNTLSKLEQDIKKKAKAEWNE